MKRLLAGSAVVFAVAAVSAWLCFGSGQAADSGKPGPSTEQQGSPPGTPGRLVVHEWGTFTSFSGADGVPAGFQPNNADLPGFIYYPERGVPTKGGRLARGGLVSMETPVIYFYTDKTMRASVGVTFPTGWITEWYPFAITPATDKELNPKTVRPDIRWDVKLLPGEPVAFPKEEGKNHYYEARQTDAVPLQTEVVTREDQQDWGLQGGTVVQREKFLFYRGVGTFQPPVTVRALGEGKVCVKNGSGGRVSGLVLLTVRAGKLGFKALDDMDAGAEASATLPETGASTASLAELLVGKLTGAGLYEKEARAMVKTWESAWFGEEGSRLMYLVPRKRTDELLRLTIDPKPDEMVRVLVGRHDFLTPEQEAQADREIRRAREAQAELAAAEKALAEIGRFSAQARQMAQKRIEKQAAKK
jgi:hypothetical protein